MKRTECGYQIVEDCEDVGTTRPPARVALPTLGVVSPGSNGDGALTNLTTLARTVARIEPTKPDPDPRPRRIRYSMAAPLPQSAPVVHRRPSRGFD